MKRFLKKLNEPFPESDTPKDNVLNIIGVGIFITLFLYFFNVGGMNSRSGKVFLICMGFGFITIVIALLFDFFCEYCFESKKG